MISLWRQLLLSVSVLAALVVSSNGLASDAVASTALAQAFVPAPPLVLPAAVQCASPDEFVYDAGHPVPGSGPHRPLRGERGAWVGDTGCRFRLGREASRQESTAPAYLFTRESDLQATRGVVKAVNLPSWRKITVDMAHVAERHMEGGALSTVGGRTFFPATMSAKGVLGAIRDAYNSATQVGAAQGTRVKLLGQGGGYDIEMWFDRATNLIETAYPVFR